METRIVTITNRDEQGWLYRIPTKTINADWHCPVCGEIMGEPHDTMQCEDGEWFSVSRWENPCGHLCTYGMLKEIEEG